MSWNSDPINIIKLNGYFMFLKRLQRSTLSSNTLALNGSNIMGIFSTYSTFRKSYERKRNRHKTIHVMYTSDLRKIQDYISEFILLVTVKTFVHYHWKLKTARCLA